MKMRGETEREPGRVETSPRPPGAGFDRQSEFAENVGAAAEARNRPIPVLDHRDSRPGRDDRRRGADVEGAVARAAGPAGIQDAVAACREGRHALAERGRGGCQLRRRLALHSQGDQHRRRVGGFGLAEQVLEHGTSLIGCQIVTIEQRRKDISEPGRRRIAHEIGPSCEGSVRVMLAANYVENV